MNAVLTFDYRRGLGRLVLLHGRHGWADECSRNALTRLHALTKGTTSASVLSFLGYCRMPEDYSAR